MTSKTRLLLGAAGIGALVLATRRRQRSESQAGGTLGALSLAIDRAVGWHRLPLPLSIAVLIGNRNVLRAKNLHDTNPPATPPTPPPAPPDQLAHRTADGTYNDVREPNMGRAGARFGRNVPLENTSPEKEPDILRPNPRDVSRELLARREFTPATTLNLFAASWIQFMVRDWFSHGKADKDHPWRIRLSPDDPWKGTQENGTMLIPRTPPAPRLPGEDPGAAPAYINTETHWWDGSQLYGSSPEQQRMVRAGEHGHLRLGSDGMLPPALLDVAEQQAGWWIGLAMLHVLFAREHNAICDRLRTTYPTWTDEELFQRARLINAALLAKIHTVEWTPAIISHPTTKVALRANWWGLQTERLHRLFGRLTPNEVVSGIPGSATEHHTAPFSITEEFVAVYRMHPLMPDDFEFRSLTTHQVVTRKTLNEVTDRQVRQLMGQLSLPDLCYSFGVAHPGAIQLHNYPRGLLEFRRPDGIVVDMGAIDIIRTRELGVPRYNEFRRLLHLKPAESFDALTENPEWASELRRVYENDIERLDLIPGMFAEPKPRGFGFSDTAFRIFILMASRRLKSDRFFTSDFTPEVYTQTGMDWIADNTMVTVLARHFPSLQGILAGQENAFHPWRAAAGS